MPYRLTVHVAHAGSRYCAMDVQLDYQPVNPPYTKQRRSRSVTIKVPRHAPALVYNQLVMQALASVLQVGPEVSRDLVADSESTRTDQLWLISETDAKLAGRREGRGRARG